MRDYQRSKVYNSESNDAYLNEVLTLEECEKLANKMYKYGLRYVKWKQPFKEITIADGRGRKHAGAYYSKIALPKWARNKLVVAHEVAHTLSPKDEKHQEKFVYIYLILVKRFCKEYYIELCNNFNKNNVKTIDKNNKPTKVRGKKYGNK
jgi:hypothetical protein